MKKAVIDAHKCDRSPFCPVVRSCPVKAIAQKKSGLFKASTPEINHDVCTGCGLCVNRCPMGAVKMISK